MTAEGNQSREIGRLERLDAHTRPPQALRDLYKKIQNATDLEIPKEVDLIDASRLRDSNRKDFKQLRIPSASSVSMEALLLSSLSRNAQSFPGIPDIPDISHHSVYASCSVQGLHFIPDLLSPDEQVSLLSKLLHRDLADQCHQTNLHKHYNIPYELTQTNLQKQDASKSSGRSFFNTPPLSPQLFQPKDHNTHKALTIQQVLDRKLRWITLGGQYDWTQKRYPETEPPAFPEDLKSMVHAFFPTMVPEAAIINIYTPGDTLSLHRDVSEVSAEGLVSISLGCDGIFIAGLEDGEESRHATFRLRSGDAIFMSGPSRFAWHGIPRIIRETCPAFLESWPAPIREDEISMGTAFEPWRDWMKNKRVNLNVRQMFPKDQSKES